MTTMSCEGQGFPTGTITYLVQTGHIALYLPDSPVVIAGCPLPEHSFHCISKLLPADQVKEK